MASLASAIAAVASAINKKALVPIVITIVEEVAHLLEDLLVAEALEPDSEHLAKLVRFLNDELSGSVIGKRRRHK